MTTAGERLRPGAAGISPGRLIALLLALAAGAFLGWYVFKTVFGDGAQVQAPLQTVTVTPRTIQQTATTSGNVVAPANSKLTFPLAGRLASISVKQGQRVQAGDEIARLDTTQLQIALDQAKSTQSTAQAKLDALLVGQTPDVIEAAKAQIVQAQAAVTAANGQVATAQKDVAAANANVVSAQAQVNTAAGNAASAQNGVQSALVGVQTAQNGVITAHQAVLNGETAVQTAQNNYQAVLNGLTAIDVAQAKSSVDSAQVELDNAQAAYNKLVNHTDLASRSETAALISATATYQAALAAFNNAQPQAANPLAVQAGQLAINAAQQQLTAAQQSQTLAQQQLQTAITNGAAQGVAPNGQTSPGIGTGGGNVCVQCIGGSIGAGQQNALADLTAAQNAANNANTAVLNAQSAYAKAQNDLAQLQNPYNTTDFTGLQATVQAAQQQLQFAQKNYDTLINLPDLQTRPETTALNSAKASYAAAIAAYNQKVQPPKATDLSNAQLAIQTAQQNLASARAAEDNANNAVQAALVAVNGAQISAGNSGNAIDAANAGVNSAQIAANAAPTEIQTAQGQVPAAQENVVAAQKKYDQTLAPPLSTDITQATEAVKQAILGVQNAQSNLDNALIVAPFNGVIATVAGNPGDQISASTVIAQIVNPNNVELDAQVDESTFSQIRVGMPVQVTLDALGGQTINGVITTIVPSGTVAQGIVLFPVVITLTSPGVIPPNQASASSILIVLQAKTNALVIPSRYIYRDANSNQVVDVVKDGKRVPTKVTPGIPGPNNTIEIASGLKSGDQIALPPKKAGAGSGTAFGAGGGVPGLGGGAGGARPAGR